MPIVTITVMRPKSREFKTMILSTVHEALCAAGVNPRDRFQRVLELDEQDFVFDESFPDVKTKRTQDFVLVEVLLGVGRSVKVKKSILGRFFRLASLAIVAIFVSGWAHLVSVGIAQAPVDWHLMLAVNVVMAALFIYICTRSSLRIAALSLRRNGGLRPARSIESASWC